MTFKEQINTYFNKKTLPLFLIDTNTKSSQIPTPPNEYVNKVCIVPIDGDRV